MTDNPALHHPAAEGPVAVVFIECEQQWRDAHDVGDARLAFLGRTLDRLARDLAALGIPFTILDAGQFSNVPKRLLAHAREVGASALSYNAEYGWNERQRDSAVDRAFAKAGIHVEVHQGGIGLPPGTVLSQKAEPFKVFTPFKRRWLELFAPDQAEPLTPPKPQGKAYRPKQIAADIDISLLAEYWPGGESEARMRLEDFASNRIGAYHEARDVPARPGTSTLSPYLSIGSLSVNQCLHAAWKQRVGDTREGADTWISELIWRDFYRHVMYHFSWVSRDRSFQRDADRLGWRDAPEDLAAWQEGRTGYPLVDAAMRQLNQTGWMHNRLRMVSAMFLTKHLLIDWRSGERYFMQKLVDGDFASNNGGWQWSASTGTDAAPYFRIFNPASQGEKFDKRGEFTRSYVPELKDVPDKYLYAPHKAKMDIDYPEPIVDHKQARERALAAFKAL